MLNVSELMLKETTRSPEPVPSEDVEEYVCLYLDDVGVCCEEFYDLSDDLFFGLQACSFTHI